MIEVPPQSSLSGGCTAAIPQVEDVVNSARLLVVQADAGATYDKIGAYSSSLMRTHA